VVGPQEGEAGHAGSQPLGHRLDLRPGDRELQLGSEQTVRYEGLEGGVDVASWVVGSQDNVQATRRVRHVDDVGNSAASMPVTTSPKPVPSPAVGRSNAASRMLDCACSSGSERRAAGYWTCDSLPTTEVLRRTGRQPDLQALCERHGALDSGPDIAGRCSAVLAKTTELADLQVILGEVSPLTDSNRRPPPYHGSLRASRAYTPVHSRRTFSRKLAYSGRSGCVARRRACRF
jgi:hypothetical protein